MTLTLLLILLPSSFVKSDSESPPKPTPLIIKLTKHNFEKVITNNEFVLVEFFNPSCWVCQVFRPEYFKLAKQLRNLASPANEIKVGKLSTVTDWSVSSYYEVRLVPTVMLFRRGVPIKYTGEKRASDIRRWVLDITSRRS
jgi:thioredoxin-like negative regulator of GroEL